MIKLTPIKTRFAKWKRVKLPTLNLDEAWQNLRTQLREASERYDRSTYYSKPIRPNYVHVPRVPGELRDKVFRALVASLVASMFLFNGVVYRFAVILQRNGGDVDLTQPHVWNLFDISKLAGVYFSLLGAGTPHLTDQLSTLTIQWLIPTFGTVLVAGVILALPYEKPIPKKYWGHKKSAEFASMQDYARANSIDHNEPGVVIGAVEPPPRWDGTPRPPRLLVYPGPRHIIVNASSRSGKDVGTVSTTNALWPEAELTLDPKIEDYPRNSGIAKHYHGKNVYLWNIGAPRLGDEFTDREGRKQIEQFGSSGYNLFDEVDWGTDKEFSQSMQLATLAVVDKVEDLDGENGHWFRTSRVLQRALMFKVAYDPVEPLKCFSRVAQIIVGGEGDSEEHAAVKNGDDAGAEQDGLHSMIEQYLGFTAQGWGPKPKWLERVIQQQRLRTEREILTMRDDIGHSMSEAQAYAKEIELRRMLEDRIKKLETELRHPDMEADIKQTMRIRGDEAGSVYSTATAKATPWLDPNVIRNTSFSSFTITGIRSGERPGAVWVGNPLERADFYDPLLGMHFDFWLRKMYPPMETDLVTKMMKSPWRWRMVWMMNEIGTILSRLTQLNRSLPVMASYRDIMVTLLQTDKQLREGLGENEVITDNAGVKAYHTPQNDKLASDLSEKMGKRMFLREDESAPWSIFGRKLIPDEIELMSPQEVRAIPSEPDFERDKNGQHLRTELGNMVGTTRKVYQLLDMTDAQADVSGKQHSITSIGWSLKVQYFAEYWHKIYRIMVSHEAVIPDRTRIERKDGLSIQAELRSQEALKKIEEPYVRSIVVRERADLAKKVRLKLLDPKEVNQALHHRGIDNVATTIEREEEAPQPAPVAVAPGVATQEPKANEAPAADAAAEKPSSAPIPGSFGFLDQ